jgi:hypothetical protein
VIQLALLTAVQLHPAAAVTVTQLLPPVLPIDWLVGLMLELHEEDVPSWLTVNVCPPTVMVPARGVEVVFAATVNVTVPLPDPLAPPVTLIQLALLVAVQAHADPAAIEIEPLPPDAGTDCEAGEMAYEHATVAAACVTDAT